MTTTRWWWLPWIAFVASCQSSQPHACVDFGFSCDCSDGLVVGDDQHEAKVCSAASVGADVNAFCCEAGNSCTCGSALCAVLNPSDYDCVCRVGVAIDDGDPVDRCAPPPGTVCCKGPIDCYCFGETCLGDDIQVPSCDLERISTCGGDAMAVLSCTP